MPREALPDIDIAHLRQWVGSAEEATEQLTPALAVRLAATLDRDDATAVGEPAPLLTHHCLCHAIAPTAALGPDGHPARGGFLPPVPLPRRMWAGGAIEFHAPLRVGDTVTRHSTVEDVALKQGRSGALCFVTVTHRYTVDGNTRITERQDIVYRAAPAETAQTGPARTPPPAPKGNSNRCLDASPTLLFRYSALTFNSHRIHYDHPYTTGEEGYPGLVVHGPLQAMLLAQYAADLRGAMPRSFRFRSFAPVFGDAALHLHARTTDNGLKLWSAAPEGPIAMEAHAQW
nr:MaoC family dehydratase N-terminal domain-containing protein [uncultured Celeribacter sp.]